MVVPCEHDDLDYLAYTKVWFDKVNRGGLFPLNNETFHQFISVNEGGDILH